MMDQLKGEMAQEMGMEYIPEPQKQQQIEQNNQFYEDLKKT